MTNPASPSTHSDAGATIRAKPFKKALANWLINDFMGMCRRRGLNPATSGISPDEFGDLIRLHYVGFFDRNATRRMLESRLRELHG